jgi:hypothetical protein
VVGAAAAEVEGKTAFGNFAAEEGAAYAESVEIRREGAVGDEFEKKFEKFFVRGGNDGVGAFGALAVAFESEGGVLASAEFERAAEIETEKPQVRGKVSAFENASEKMFLSGREHVNPSARAQNHLNTKAKHAETRSAPNENPDLRQRLNRTKVRLRFEYL